MQHIRSNMEAIGWISCNFTLWIHTNMNKFLSIYQHEVLCSFSNMMTGYRRPSNRGPSNYCYFLSALEYHKAEMRHSVNSCLPSDMTSSPWKHMQRSPLPAAKTSNKNVCTRPVNGSLQTHYLIGCLISETRFHSDFFSPSYEWLSSPVWVSAPVFRHVPGLLPHGEGFISRGWEVAAEENSCLANCMHC